MSCIQIVSCPARLSVQWRDFLFSMLSLLGIVLGSLAPGRAKAVEPVGPQEKFHLDVTFLDPDGSPVRELYIARGDNFTPFFLNPDEGAHENRLRKSEDANGLFRVLFRESNVFVAFWNDSGFAKYSVESLKDKKEVRLVPWGSLKIKVLDKEMPAGLPMSVANTMTSDNVHRGFDIKIKGTLDENGCLELFRVPPGELRIWVNNREVREGNTSWEEYDRIKHVQIRPNTSHSVELGNRGSGVTGKIVTKADERDVSKLFGYIENQESHDQVPLTILADGRFTTDRIPFGDVIVRVYDRNFLTNRRGTKNFDLHIDGSEIGGRKYVGSVAVGSPKSLAYLLEQSAGEPFVLKESEDDFATQESIAFVVAKRARGFFNEYLFLDRDGKPIRELSEWRAPGGWMGSTQFVAGDPQRKRFYLLAHRGDEYGSSLPFLLAFNETGKQLYEVSLPYRQSHQIAVDSESGRVWILSRRNLGDTDVIVLDSEGKKLHNFQSNAFCLAYSSTDEAMWLAGPQAVEKVDPSDYDILASSALDENVFTLSYALALPDGGIAATEVSHPDLPASKNRLWQFDQNAEKTGLLQLESLHPKGLKFAMNRLLVTGFEMPGPGLSGKVRNETLCLGADLAELERWPEVNDVIPTTAGICIAIQKDGLYRLQLGDNDKLEKVLMTPSEEIIWGRNIHQE